MSHPCEHRCIFLVAKHHIDFFSFTAVHRHIFRGKLGLNLLPSISELVLVSCILFLDDRVVIILFNCITLVLYFSSDKKKISVVISTYRTRFFLASGDLRNSLLLHIFRTAGKNYMQHFWSSFQVEAFAAGDGTGTA